MEEVASSPEGRFLAWHRSGEPLPLDRAIRDHARAAKHTVAVSTAERYGQFAERVVARLGDIDLRHSQKEDIGRLIRAECADRLMIPEDCAEMSLTSGGGETGMLRCL
jgi:hypothetical protein